MKYLCLVYAEETTLHGLPQSEYDVLVEDSLALVDELRSSGQYISADALQPVETATTIRVRNGKVSVTDGPFAETKEQLGGFYLVEARDLNEAIRIASRIAGARIGCVEVRPLKGLTAD